MRAWSFDRTAPVAEGRLRLADRPVPVPGEGEVLLRVLACGVCRTDLHLVGGDLAVRRPRTVPGHQVVGRVVDQGPGAERFGAGDLVGIAWLRSTCGQCRWCVSGAENLCPGSTYTGWDADGGLAELATVPAAFAYPLPEGQPLDQLAPLLCAGIIGFRAMRRARVGDGTRLGLYGFGSSAHITAQVAASLGAELFVMTRGEGNRALARELGASYVGDAYDVPPVPLDSAVVFAPVGDLVPVALSALDRGGTLALAGIHMTDVPALDYKKHLFYERDLRTVTSNTRADGADLFAHVAAHPVTVHTTAYDFTEADRALLDLAEGRLSGSAVVVR